MQQTTVTLEERNELGSRAVKKIRKNGFIPAVVYGHDYASKAVMAPYLDAAKAYQQAGKHHPVEVQIGDKKRIAMIKRVDIEPVKHKLLHIAFHVIKQNEKVQTEIPVKVTLEGETPAEKAGLVLIKNIDVILVEALPGDLPEFLAADGEKLANAGDHITVGDIKAPAGVTKLSDANQTIVSAVEPAALMAANDAAGGEAESEAGVESEHGAEEDQPADEDAKKASEQK